jgi:hypothetical protein
MGGVEPAAATQTVKRNCPFAGRTAEARIFGVAQRLGAFQTHFGRAVASALRVNGAVQMPFTRHAFEHVHPRVFKGKARAL